MSNYSRGYDAGYDDASDERDRIADHARRWKALARRLRADRDDWRAIANSAGDDHAADVRETTERHAEQIAALIKEANDQSELHAREMMASATRYGEAIERLQRERDEAEKQRNEALGMLKDEKRAHERDALPLLWLRTALEHASRGHGLLRDPRGRAP